MGSFSLGALLGRGAAGDDSFLFFFLSSFLFFFLSQERVVDRRGAFETNLIRGRNSKPRIFEIVQFQRYVSSINVSLN